MTKKGILSSIVFVLGLFSAPLRADPLNLVGTGDGLDIFRELSKAFSAAKPGGALLVPPSIGSGGAIAAVGAGRERIGRIARPLSPLERSSGLVSAPAFDIPIAFYVHPSVSVRSLSPRQLSDVFSGKVANWSALGGPDLKVRVVRREESDSSLSALRASLPEFRDLVLTERSKLALTTQEALASVRENEGAIGFAPYSVAAAETMGVMALEGRSPTNRTYPARVPLAIIWRSDRSDGDIAAFIAFLSSPEAHRVITSQGAIPADK